MPYSLITQLSMTSALIITLLFSTGCALLNDRGPQRQARSSSLVEFLYPDGKVPDNLREARPQLQLPLRIGLAFVPDSSGRNALKPAEAEQQQILQKVAEHFSQRAFIDDVVSIPHTYLAQGKGFDSLQQVAQLFDVDVVALVSYNQLSRHNNNMLSLAYWTIVGAYIVPGDEHRTQTFVDTAVFDVGTRKLLMRAPGLDQRQRVTTAIASNSAEQEILNVSFNAAADKMIANLDGELDRFVERVKRKEIPADVGYRSGYSGGAGALSGALLLLLGGLALRRRYQRNAC